MPTDLFLCGVEGEISHVECDALLEEAILVTAGTLKSRIKDDTRSWVPNRVAHLEVLVPVRAEVGEAGRGGHHLGKHRSRSQKTAKVHEDQCGAMRAVGEKLLS